MWDDFRQFAMKGNVVDLTVGVIIGTAFGKIITSMVNDVAMPILGLFLGGVNFTALQFQVGDAVIKYGACMQSVVDFFIVAATVFAGVRFLNKLKRKEEVKPDPAPAPCGEEALLAEIRDLLKYQLGDKVDVTPKSGHCIQH
jgi:large conductance mechanosensitive channel